MTLVLFRLGGCLRYDLRQHEMVKRVAARDDVGQADKPVATFGCFFDLFSQRKSLKVLHGNGLSSAFQAYDDFILSVPSP